MGRVHSHPRHGSVQRCQQDPVLSPTLGPSFPTGKVTKAYGSLSLDPGPCLCAPTPAPLHLPNTGTMKLGPCRVPLCMSLLLPTRSLSAPASLHCGNSLGRQSRAGVEPPPSVSTGQPGCPCTAGARSSLSWSCPWPGLRHSLWNLKPTGEQGTSGCSPGWGRELGSPCRRWVWRMGH